MIFVQERGGGVDQVAVFRIYFHRRWGRRAGLGHPFRSDDMDAAFVCFEGVGKAVFYAFQLDEHFRVGLEAPFDKKAEYGFVHPKYSLIGQERIPTIRVKWDSLVEIQKIGDAGLD